MLAEIRKYVTLGLVVAAVSGCNPDQPQVIRVPQPTRQDQPAATPAARIPTDSSNSPIYIPYVETSPQQCPFMDYSCVQEAVERGNWAGAYVVAPWLRKLGHIDPWDLTHAIFVPYVETSFQPCPFMDYSCVQEAVERGNWAGAYVIAPWLRKLGHIDPWDLTHSINYPPQSTTKPPPGTVDIARFFFPRYSVRLTGSHPISFVRVDSNRVAIVKGNNNRNFETYILTDINGQEVMVLQQDNTAGIYRFFGPGASPTVWLPRYVFPGQTYSVPYEDNWMQRYDADCHPITEGSGNFGFDITVTILDNYDFGGEMGKRKDIASLEYSYHGVGGGTRKEIFLLDNEFGLLKWILYDESGNIISKSTFKYFTESPPVQPDLTALCS